MPNPATRSSTRLAYRQRIHRAQQFLEAHLDEPVPAEAIARVGGMSLHHFHRVFRGMTGESVMGYVRRLRLERAARALRHSQRSVADIALEAAYGSHEAFTRAFADHYGMPPSAYRRAGEAGIGAAPCSDIRAPDHVEVRREPARTVVSMRHVGPYEGVPGTWEALHAWFAHAFGEGGVQLALVPDDPMITEPPKLRYDACIEVPAGTRRADLPPGPVTLSTLPGGLYAVAEHRGPYEGLHELYLSLIGGWFPESGHALSIEPVVERYLNAPPETAPPDLVTEIWVRIEERGWQA